MVERLDALCMGLFSFLLGRIMICERIPFLNIWVDVISLGQVVEAVFAAIEQGDKLQLVFLNALKIYEIQKDPRMARAMQEAELILADGVPVLWASRLLGRPLPGRVNGTDLFEILLAGAEQRGKRVFLLGATQQNLERLVEVLRQRHPKLKLVGWRNGYFSDDDDQEVINQINESKADLLFLGFSSPKKELWANKYKKVLNVPVIQGVGGSFDVVAGIIARAPRWAQRSGLEWLIRVIREPRRMFVRYLRCNTVFIYLVVQAWVRERILGRAPITWSIHEHS